MHRHSGLITGYLRAKPPEAQTRDQQTFSKGPGSTYFCFCEPCGLCCKISTLPLQLQTVHKQVSMLCPVKLFTYTVVCPPLLQSTVGGWEPGDLTSVLTQLLNLDLIRWWYWNSVGGWQSEQLTFGISIYTYMDGLVFRLKSISYIQYQSISAKCLISVYFHMPQIILRNYFKPIKPQLVNRQGLRAKTNDVIIFAVIHKGFGCLSLITDILLKKISLCPEARLMLASNYRINPEIKHLFCC